MKRIKAVVVAMIAIASCGGSGKQVVGSYCRPNESDNRWQVYGWVWLTWSNGTTSKLDNPEFPNQGAGVPCFAGVA